MFGVNKIPSDAVMRDTIDPVATDAINPIFAILFHHLQNCERSAGKRLVRKIRAAHPKLKIMIGGDGLYSNQPFIDELKICGMSFVLVVSKQNIVELVKAGRACWKIENETFNTLKNQGYHLEHNFGHGKKHLSNNFLQNARCTINRPTN